MRFAALIATLALAFPVSASAVTFTQVPIAPTSKGWGEGGAFGPREWFVGPPAPLEASLAETAVQIMHAEKVHGFATLGMFDPYIETAHPWGEVEGSWCEGESVYVKGVPHAIPNPSGQPEGWFGVPNCTTVAIAPDGALWFGDRGDDAIGKVEPNGSVVEYAMPVIPASLYGYPGDAVVNPPGAMATVDGVLWVAESNAKAEVTVCSTCDSVKATNAKARVGHNRTRRKPHDHRRHQL